MAGDIEKKYKLNVPTMTDTEFFKRGASADVVMEVHHKMEDGDSFEGKFLGWDERDLNDKDGRNGKKTVSVACFEVIDPKTKGAMVLRLTAGHEMVSQLDGVPSGTAVAVFRIGKVDIGNGHSVTRYAIQKPKSLGKVYAARAPIKDGRRNTAAALPGATEAKQLPDGE